jgi:hypothetical protein
VPRCAARQTFYDVLPVVVYSRRHTRWPPLGASPRSRSCGLTPAAGEDIQSGLRSRPRRGGGWPRVGTGVARVRTGGRSSTLVQMRLGSWGGSDAPMALRLKESH